MSTTIIQLDLEDLAAVVGSEVERVLAAHSGQSRGFMRVPEAAAFLAMSDNALRVAVKRGEIPCHRLGKRLLFDPAELLEFVKGGSA